MRRMLLQFVAAMGLTAASIIAGAAEGTSTGDFEITSPWIRAMLPGQPVAGGFLSIANGGKDDDRLVGASTPDAGRVEIHSMEMVDGVMVMRPVDGGLAIAPGARVDLEPGGFHLMFLDIAAPYQDGSSVQVTLSFEKAGQVTVDFPVRRQAAAHAGSHIGHAQMSDDRTQISSVMKGTWETTDAPLAVDPVVISNDYAIAGWAQAGRGGRALVKRGAHGWAVVLCTGDGVKSAENLRQMGVPGSDADALAEAIAEAEAQLDAALVALFSSFEGTVMMDDPAHGGHETGSGHGNHGG